MAAASVGGGGRWHIGHEAPHPKPRHTQATAKGAYVVHCCHFCSVPGSNVLVERRRLEKRLRAEPRALKEPRR